MDRKFLEGLGLEKSVIDQILDQNGTEVAALNARVKAKDTEISTLRSDLTTANSKVSELSKVDVQTLQQQLQAEKDGRAADRRAWTLETVLAKAGCTDSDYIKYKLGDSVDYADDGSIKDADNAVKEWKEKFPNFFGANTGADNGAEKGAPSGTGSAGNFGRDHSGTTPAKKNPYTKEGWNLSEQYRLEINDPAKAQKLKAEAEG